LQYNDLLKDFTHKNVEMMKTYLRNVTCLQGEVVWPWICSCKTIISPLVNVANLSQLQLRIKKVVS